MLLLAASDPVAHLALALGLLLLASRLGGEVATRLGQPQVLGELVAGMLLSALPGVSFFRDLGADPSIDMLARLGALVLLFDAGLALNVRDVLRVGGAAARVAVLGTVASFALGWAVVAWLLPGAAPATRAFLAGALTATSVGISARVLKDIGADPHHRGAHRPRRGGDRRRARPPRPLPGERLGGRAPPRPPPRARWRCSSWSARRSPSSAAPSSSGGSWPRACSRSPRACARAARWSSSGLSFCFLLAWAADAIGLAPIVGAFTAGLVLEEAHWREFLDRGEPGLDQEIEPLSAFLVPLFFALLGIRTDLRAFAEPGTLALALGLTVAAVLGKLAAGLGVARGGNRLAVSFGMMPRGEVSLIFASLGLTLRRHRPPGVLRAGGDGGADDAGDAFRPEVELRQGREGGGGRPAVAGRGVGRRATLRGEKARVWGAPRRFGVRRRGFGVRLDASG